jgi:hypothetical protein
MSTPSIPHFHPFPMGPAPPTLSRAELKEYAVKRRAELANSVLMRLRSDVLNAATGSSTTYSITTADIRTKFGQNDQLTVVTDDDFLAAFKAVFHDSDVDLVDGTITVKWD